MYDKIFTPFHIGKLEVKNRVIMAPMLVHTPEITHEDGSFTQRGIEYYLERARGGVGLITTGAMQVTDLFDDMGSHLSRNRETYIEHMKPLAEGAHQYGTKVFIQMSAGVGRCMEPGLGTCKEYVSASDDIPNVWFPEEKCRAVTKEEIETVIKAFGSCAKMVKDAGLDGVQVHAVHEGYLLDQFSMECTNHRTDEYGGSLENRLRFATEIVKEIKKECGEDFPVSIRFSARSMMKGFNDGALPGEDFVEFGRNLEEAEKVAVLLEKAGYDMLDMDNGCHDAWHFCHPPVYMPEAVNMAEAKHIKKFVNIPVSCSGKMNAPEIVGEALENGELDAITIGRALLADPQWVNKLQRGEEDDIRPCINCYEGCGMDHTADGHPGPACAVNIATGMEREHDITKAEEVKNVLIIGGGLAGMEAARVCALRGHNVTLAERTARLGGMFIAASAMTFKERDRKLIRWYIKQMRDLKVKLCLNTEINESNIASFNADKVILASGSGEKFISLPGADSNNVLLATQALLNRELVGKDIVIVGGGLTGLEIAYDFAKEGRKVTVLEMMDAVLDSPQVPLNVKMIIPLLLNHHHVNLELGARLQQVKEGSVEYLRKDGSLVNVDADTVILSVGLKSNNALAEKLNAMGVDCEVIGDASEVANVLGSVWTGYRAAIKI